ncbi:MAG: hypothetical protein CFE21_15390 [Bacteroidetes bacterium B1(2017)]|nr:MAG: hypothetical protein CFE21_15390 [Bacteroidetes bacterium B1(2017)]
MNLTESELIAACLKRNSKAERLLWDTYAPKLFGVCRRYCPIRTEAEEVLQEGFIKIFDKLSQYKQNGSFESWLRKIMINTALTQLRLNKKYTFELDVNELTEVFLTDTDPLKQLEAKQLMNLIQTLPYPQQSVMNLFSIDGYSHKEIAELLGITEASSRVLLHRAKAKLIEQSAHNYPLSKKYGSK